MDWFFLHSNKNPRKEEVETPILGGYGQDCSIMVYVCNGTLRWCDGFSAVESSLEWKTTDKQLI